jgi:hypothetical protein
VALYLFIFWLILLPQNTNNYLFIKGLIYRSPLKMLEIVFYNWVQRLVQVECGILKRLPVKPTRSQAGFLLNIILKPSSVKDGLAVVEQGVNTGTPRPPALHLHFVELNPAYAG